MCFVELGCWGNTNQIIPDSPVLRPIGRNPLYKGYPPWLDVLVPDAAGRGLNPGSF